MCDMPPTGVSLLNFLEGQLSKDVKGLSDILIVKNIYIHQTLYLLIVKKAKIDKAGN